MLFKTIDGKIFETYQESCYTLELLADDNEFIDAIKETSEFASIYQLRRLCYIIRHEYNVQT